MKSFFSKNMCNCSLLENEKIVFELNNFVNGYHFDESHRLFDRVVFFFNETNGNNSSVSLCNNQIIGAKLKGNIAERIVAKDNEIIHIILEKRENGVIYTVLKKKYKYSKREKEYELVDLSEERFVYTRGNINSLSRSFDFDGASPDVLLVKIDNLDNPKSNCSCYNVFRVQSGDKKTDNGVDVVLNDTTVSSLYPISGEDKVYRIYDLYRGIITKRCEEDIFDISLNRLTASGFGLLELTRIKDEEDKLVGTGIYDLDYLEYLKKFYYSSFGYDGDILLDRKSMLNIISRKLKASALAKKDVEKNLGISYEEFDSLSFDEQQKIIEEVTGKPTIYDTRPRIDGIPVDSEHMVTLEDIDKKMGIEIGAYKVKSRFKKLKSLFKR